jgi:hypothetical protein
MLVDMVPLSVLREPVFPMASPAVDGFAFSTRPIFEEQPAKESFLLERRRKRQRQKAAVVRAPVSHAATSWFSTQKSGSTSKGKLESTPPLEADKKLEEDYLEVAGSFLIPTFTRVAAPERAMSWSEAFDSAENDSIFADGKNSPQAKRAGSRDMLPGPSASVSGSRDVLPGPSASVSEAEFREEPERSAGVDFDTVGARVLKAISRRREDHT